jgi:hypothetical protein
MRSFLINQRIVLLRASKLPFSSAPQLHPPVHTHHRLLAVHPVSWRFPYSSSSPCLQLAISAADHGLIVISNSLNTGEAGIGATAAAALPGTPPNPNSFSLGDFSKGNGPNGGRAAGPVDKFLPGTVNFYPVVMLQVKNFPP